MMLDYMHEDLRLRPYFLQSRLVATLLVACALVSTSAAPPNGRILFRHGFSGTEHAPELHRRLRRGLAEQHLRSGRSLLQSANISDLQFVSLGKHVGVDMVEIPEGVSYQWILEQLKNHPEIEFAEEDKIVSAYATPNDPGVSQQWALYQLGLFTDSPLDNGLVEQGAWNRTYGGDVIVCVIDSGVDYNHPDLAANIWTNPDEIPDNGIDDDDNGYIDDYRGINVMTITGDVMDDNFHGTHLSGMVGAVCNNNLGICGISPVVKVMGCKFLDNKGNGYTSDAVKCLDYSLQMGVDITLNSYGGLNADSDALKTAITAANRAGQLFVTAAGNDYGTDIDDTPTFPAAYQMPNILSVISTNETGQLAAFSNYGAQLADIAAPGSHILSTVLKGQYGEHDGTSQSAGYVAGAAALLLAAYRQAGFTNATGAEMKDLLMKAARKLPDLEDKCKAGGMLDVGAAMSLVPLSAPSPPDNGSWILAAISPPAPGSHPKPPPTPSSSGLFGTFWGIPDLLGKTPSSLWGVPEASSKTPSTSEGVPETKSKTPSTSKGVPDSKSKTPSSPGGPPVPKSKTPSSSRQSVTLDPESLLPPGLRPSNLLSSKSARSAAPLKAPAAKAPTVDSRMKSIAQAFRGSFGLNHSSLTFIPHNSGDFSTCLEKGISDLPSSRSAGIDITSDVVAGNSTGYVVPLEGPITVGTLKVWSIAVTPHGDLLLFNSSQPIPSAPSQEIASAGNWGTFFGSRRIAPLGSEKPLTPNGTIMLQRRPDRIVVTYINVASEDDWDPSTFQVEVFTGGRTLKAGSVRMSWLSVGSASGVVGISGDRTENMELFQFQDSGLCPRPAFLEVDFLPPVQTHPGQRDPNFHSLRLKNLGSLVLNVGLDVLPRGSSIISGADCPSVLQPSSVTQESWTMSKAQPNSLVRASRAALEAPCTTAKDEPTYENITRSAVAHYTRKLSLPMQIIAAYSRVSSCNWQWLALSSIESFPTQFGDNSTLWFVMSPHHKFLLVGNQTLKTREACADYGPNVLNITVDSQAVIFRDDQCGRIVARHYLGERPLFLHTAVSTLPKCKRGDMKWEHLEVMENLKIPPIKVNSTIPTTLANLLSPAASPSAPAPKFSASLHRASPPHPEVESASIGAVASKSVVQIVPPDSPSPGPSEPQSSSLAMRLLVRRRPPSPRSSRKPALSTAQPPVLPALAPDGAAADEEDSPWVLPGIEAKQSASPASDKPDVPTSVAWVQLTQRSIAVPPGGAVTVGVLVNSTGLQQGLHEAILVLRSNDPQHPILRAPLQLRL
eukprot:jgi/Botrbrau1/7423/Bobra.0112s0022.1